MASKVALVTGGSSGIGEATALKLRELGYTTYAAARRAERMDHLTAAGIRTLAMDVTDEESMQAGIKRILAEQGRIDVLVNGAGYGSYGAIEDVPLAEARHQFEVNVFGGPGSPSSPSKPSATACAWRSHRSASGQPRTMKWLSAQDSTIAPDAPQ